MDSDRFDSLTRQFAQFLTRRHLFKTAAALAPPALLGAPSRRQLRCEFDSCFFNQQCCCCGEGCDPLCSSPDAPEQCPRCPVPCTGQLSCEPGFSVCCCGDRVGDCCKDLQNDPASCGSCHAAHCAGTCSGGECTCNDANKVYCPGAGCVNLDDDEAHCGACDAEPCLGRCVDGECTCGGFKELCSTGCADLTSDARHCGRCEHACAANETCVEGICCPAGHGMCWDQCIDLREDRNHCGACGHACTTLQECVDGVCVRDEAPTDGCSAQSLRLWINAFYPGVVDGFTRQRDIAGLLESVSSPNLNETAIPCSGAQTCLRTDRRPDPRLEQNWQSFFSRDAAAPSMAHAELEIDLRDRRAIRAVVPQVAPRYGLLQHVVDTGVSESRDDQVTIAEVACESPISGTPRWFHDFDTDSIDHGIRFNVRATWNAWPTLTETQCIAPDSGSGDCPFDAFAVCPLGSIQGSMVVQVLPDEGVVRITIPKLEVPQYPAIEIYAALDDGNVVRVWTSKAKPVPLAELHTKLPTVIENENLTIEIPCGCGPCDAGETTCEIDPTCISDAYFILSSSENLRLNETTLGHAPDAAIDADGPMTVTKNGLPHPVFSGQDTHTPPIGFAGKRGDRLDVQIACPDGAESCPGALAGPLFLYRFDSLFAEPTRQVLIPGRVPLPLDATHQRHVITLSRSTKPGGVCRRLESGLTQVCTDILSNQERCGGLSDKGEFACGESEVCLNGVCRCPIHLERVGPRQCADLLNDNQHCGEPQNVCAAGERCVNGACRD